MYFTILNCGNIVDRRVTTWETYYARQRRALNAACPHATDSHEPTRPILYLAFATTGQNSHWLRWVCLKSRSVSVIGKSPTRTWISSLISPNRGLKSSRGGCSTEDKHSILENGQRKAQVH